MNQSNLAIGLYMPRQMADRRVATTAELPYQTEEGLIMFDRREGGDRRATPRQPANDSSILPQTNKVAFAV
ncbi:MAG: hypothetical protein ACXWJK_00765 [Burkholderiaceae bacterium]